MGDNGMNESFLMQLIQLMKNQGFGDDVQEKLKQQMLPGMNGGGVNLQNVRNMPELANNQQMQNFLGAPEHAQMIREDPSMMSRMGSAAMSTPYEAMKFMAQGGPGPMSAMSNMGLNAMGGGGPAKRSQPDIANIIAAWKAAMGR
jgi:hypothetical protein